MKNFRIKLFSLSLYIICNTFAMQASDFTIIYNRMYAEYTGNPSESSISSILNLMSANGSFSDINYSTTSGDPRTHVQRLSTLAQAYKNPSNSNFNNANVKAKFLLSLNFWIVINHNADNWWYRYIAYPKDLSKGIILMSEEIKADPVLFDKTIKYLRWSFENSDASRLTGANGCDIIIGSLTASILTENNDQMIQFKTEMDRLLSIQLNEGIEADYMFGQHSGNGRQVYIMNYGKEYLNSALYYIEFCNGTQYNTENVSVLENFYINALQWIFYNNHYDPNQAGRFNSSSNSMSTMIQLGDRMVALNTARKTELEKVRDRIEGENSLLGNRMFWRFDYMINRMANYMTSSRMSSTRTVGSEAGNGSGEYNYYSGSGTNYIFFTGKEYDGNYFSIFNKRQFPGITAEQDNGTLPIPNWGANGGNGNTFAGGTSDSTYGVCGMILQRRNVTANKSWFYFDDEFACLGAGINQSNGTASVYTTLNQCNKDAALPQYSVNGNIGTLNGSQTLTNPDWILNGGIAYFNFDQSSNIVVSTANNLFSANVDHGKNPLNKTYAYAVKPGVSSTAEASTYFGNVPFIIESNTNLIQAVRHKILNITEALFYQAGTLYLSNGTIIRVDQPCALLLKEGTAEITIANPNCESNNPPTINVTLLLKNKVFNLLFNMPTGVNSGSSISQLDEGVIYSIPEQMISPIKVYPNPFKSVLTINARNSAFKKAILIDINGKTIASATLKQDQITELVISKKELPAGVYFLKLSGEAHTQTIKVIRSE